MKTEVGDLRSEVRCRLSDLGPRTSELWPPPPDLRLL